MQNTQLALLLHSLLFSSFFQKQPFADLFKIGFLKNFAVFTGKHLCWSLQHRCFPVNIVKLSRSAFYRTPLVAASQPAPHFTLYILVCDFSLTNSFH